MPPLPVRSAAGADARREGGVISGICSLACVGLLTWAAGACGRAFYGAERAGDVDAGGDSSEPALGGPVRSRGAPLGTLPAGTTEVTLSLDTDRQATCRYGSAPNTPFQALSGTFATADARVHTAAVGGLEDGGAYLFFVRCAASLSGGENDDDYAIAFTIDVPPRLSSAAPLGVLPTGTTQTTLTVATDRPCSCRYATNPGVAFASMPSSFAATGAQLHTTPLSSLREGLPYAYYVRCRDGLGSTNEQDFAISFSVGPAATPIYRSVGPGNDLPLATGAGNPMTVQQSVATFSSALPARVGLGDGVQYDSDGDGLVDALGFIHARMTSTDYLLRRADGSDATPTSAPDQEWTAMRAYLSLLDAETGWESYRFDAAVANFDAWAGGKDLVAAGELWNIVCYADAADVGPVVLSQWTTGRDNFLHVFTPCAPHEVGVCQRHRGSWDTGGYRLLAPTGVAISSYVNHVRIDGLQLSVDDPVSEQAALYHVQTGGAAGSDIRISSTIMRATGIGGRFGLDLSQPGTYRAWNNIIYDFTNPYACLTVYMGGSIAFLSNNTVWNCPSGYYVPSASSVVARNNLAQRVGAGFVGNFSLSSSHNITDSADTPPGSGSLGATSVAVIDELGRDLHLSAGTAAIGAGTDLSSDPDLPIATDVDGQQRLGAWDVGADEY